MGKNKLMKLNLGCGKDIKKGYVNLDIVRKGNSPFRKIKVDAGDLILI